VHGIGSDTIVDDLAVISGYFALTHLLSFVPYHYWEVHVTVTTRAEHSVVDGVRREGRGDLVPPVGGVGEGGYFV